jgi:hypothetical protein
MAAAGEDSEASARDKAARQARGDMVICCVLCVRFGEVCRGSAVLYRVDHITCINV